MPSRRNREDRQSQQPQQRQPTNDEQVLLRQSAPRPEVADALEEQRQKSASASSRQRADMITGGQNMRQAISLPIGKEALHKATLTLQKYKEGKANLEQRIISNEQWYKIRHWECMRDKTSDIQPSSAWLFNCLANKHADAMDNYPSPNILV